ncbi:MAG TPA: hypothetical protein V6D08_19745 [Candidatus Obscuribacterales bacterium]
MAGSNFWNHAAGATAAALILAVAGMTASGAAEQQGGMAVPEALAGQAADMERAYALHSSVRNQIALKLERLWFMERELKAQYEDCGEHSELVDLYQVERELRGVREQIDCLRAELSRQNKIIAIIGQSIRD